MLTPQAVVDAQCSVGASLKGPTMACQLEKEIRIYMLTQKYTNGKVNEGFKKDEG